MMASIPILFENSGLALSEGLLFLRACSLGLTPENSKNPASESLGGRLIKRRILKA